MEKAFVLNELREKRKLAFLVTGIKRGRAWRRPTTRLAFGLVGFACLGWAADLHVDHVTVAVRDLQTMRAEFAAAGIRTEYGGKHTNGLTEMALASFADGSYLELIAAQDPKAGAARHYWGKFIDENAGPCAWAIFADDLDGMAKRLGAHVTESGRARPDGVMLRWRSASIGPEAQGTFLPFMIHDVTDRKLRAEPSGKPTMPEWRGVTAVYVAVKNLDEAVGAETARFAGTPVVLTSSDKGWVAERLEKFGEAPCAFVIARSGKGGGKLRWLGIKGMRIGVR